ALPQQITTAFASPPAALAFHHAAPAADGSMEAVIARQLDLMQQQIALLRGGSLPVPLPEAPATVASPIPNKPLEPAPSVRPAAAESSASAGGVSAPTTAINRKLDDALTDRQRRHLDELIESYIARTHTSKELTTTYRQWH